MAHRAAGPHYQTWPWILLIVAGLPTTAAGSRYVMLGWLMIGTGIVLIVRAARRNRALRRGARPAPSPAGSPAHSGRQRPARPARRPAAGRRPRSRVTGRRVARQLIRLLP